MENCQWRRNHAGNGPVLSVTNGSNLTFGKKQDRERVDVRNAKKNFTAEIVVTETNVIKRILPTIIWKKSYSRSNRK